mmetsp:Transcript_13850/g.26074  ORF Transcript_13850/g.26074 Transcript_13850/m.26074 type:complete len:82 (+) Transcript_13850:1049-1294(+)
MIIIMNAKNKSTNQNHFLFSKSNQQSKCTAQTNPQQLTTNNTTHTFLKPYPISRILSHEAYTSSTKKPICPNPCRPSSLPL